MIGGDSEREDLMASAVEGPRAGEEAVIVALVVLAAMVYVLRCTATRPRLLTLSCTETREEGIRCLLLGAGAGAGEAGS